MTADMRLFKKEEHTCGAAQIKRTAKKGLPKGCHVVWLFEYFFRKQPYATYVFTSTLQTKSLSPQSVF